MNNTSHTTKEIHSSTINHLDSLIAICKDGEAGFRTATEDVSDTELKAVFTRLSGQRADFAAELQLCVQHAGEEPRDSTTVAGKIHRGWIGLKSVLSKNDAHAVLAECERGEDEAVSAYREVLLEAVLDPSHHLLLSNQAAAVLAAHDEIRNLRDHPFYAHAKK